MSLFNQIKKIVFPEDITPNVLDQEFFNLYSSLNNRMTEHDNWEPTISAASSMTISSSTIEWAKYTIIGKRVFIDIRISFTTAGTASQYVYFTAPPGLAPISSVNLGGGCRIIDITGPIAGTYAWDEALQLFSVTRYDAANWGIGANRLMLITHNYEINK